MKDTGTTSGRDGFVPRVKDTYEVVPSGGGLSHLRSGGEIVLTVGGRKGNILAELLLAIDGQTDARALARRMRRSAGEETVFAALEFLLREGIIEDARSAGASVPDRLRHQADYLSHYLPNPAECIDRLARTRCLVLGDGDAAGTVAAALEAHGFGRADARAIPPADGDVAAALAGEELESAGAVVLITEAYRPAACREVNRCCLARGAAVLFADVSSGNHAVVGPLCVPGQSSCYACYEVRLLANTDTPEERLAYEAFLETGRSRRGTFGRLRALEQMTCAVVVVEVLSHLTGYRAARTIDGTLVIDVHEPEIHREPVLKLPGCPACAEVAGPQSPGAGRGGS